MYWGRKTWQRQEVGECIYARRAVELFRDLKSGVWTLNNALHARPEEHCRPDYTYHYSGLRKEKQRWSSDRFRKQNVFSRYLKYKRYLCNFRIMLLSDSPDLNDQQQRCMQGLHYKLWSTTQRLSSDCCRSRYAMHFEISLSLLDSVLSSYASK